MPKDVQFTAYDLERKKARKLDCPPKKILASQLDPREWARATKSATAGGSQSGRIKKTRGRAAKKKTAPKLPKRALDVLKIPDPYEWTCLQCQKGYDDPDCNSKCYREFKKQFIGNKIEIRGPGRLAYMAFTKPGVHIAKGTYLGEYVGDLRPLDSEQALESLYCTHVRDQCIIDAEQSGNWTRFINSSCRPNLRCSGDSIGKRHAVVFQALKDIGPEEELTFNYGPNYFRNAGFLCACDARKKSHKPAKLK